MQFTVFTIPEFSLSVYKSPLLFSDRFLWSGGDLVQVSVRPLMLL